MHPTVRWILFIFFTLLFFISAPLLVLYTAGYRFNFESRSFLRTGVLSIGTIPRGAEISLNGTSVSDTTPAVLKQLMPGRYQLSLSREGYHPWEESVQVKSGETTLLSSILLFLQEDPVALFSQPITTITPSPGSDLFASITQNEAQTELQMTNAEGKTVLVTSLPRLSTPTVLWSAQGTFLVLFDAEANTIDVFQSDGSPVPLTFSDFEKQKIENIFWAPSSNHLLTIISEGMTKTIDVENGSITPLAETAVIPLDASLLTLQTTTEATEVHLKENGVDRIIALLPASSYTLIDRDRSLLLLRDAQNTLVLLDLRSANPLLFKQVAPLEQWNHTAGLIALSDGYEVNLYDTQTHQMEFITRQSVPLVALAVHPSGHTLLLATATDLFAIGRDLVEDIRPTTPLLTVQEPIKTFWLSLEGKTVFLETVQSKTSSILSLPLTK